jgi:hypothetical protein
MELQGALNAVMSLAAHSTDWGHSLAGAAEQAQRPSEARTDGAGLLLAESMVGIGYGLHSKAVALLPLLLREDVLSVKDLKAHPLKVIGGLAISSPRLGVFLALVACVIGPLDVHEIDRILDYGARMYGDRWQGVQIFGCALLPLFGWCCAV